MHGERVRFRLLEVLALGTICPLIGSMWGTASDAR